jgi:hypothetical protein
LNLCLSFRWDSNSLTQNENGSGTLDAEEEGILDLLATKQWAIKLATEAARTVLSVDQIIVARQAGGPKPPGPNAVSPSFTLPDRQTELLTPNGRTGMRTESRVISEPNNGGVFVHRQKGNQCSSRQADLGRRNTVIHNDMSEIQQAERSSVSLMVSVDTSDSSGLGDTEKHTIRYHPP